MIESLECKNLRGKSDSLKLGPRTLVVGPNGSGKSTLAATVNLALLGYCPPYSVRETFANASGDCMVASVTIDGKKITRTWKKGKNISEKLEIDGIEVGRNSAEQMIQMAIGKEPQVIDVAAFFALSSAQQRKELLGIVADAVTQEKLLTDEESIRKAMLAKRQERQAAEKAVQNMTASQVEQGSSASSADLAKLKHDLANAEKLLDEVRERVASGKANDAARARIEKQVKDLPALQKKLDEAVKTFKEEQKRIQSLQKDLDTMGKPEVVQTCEGLPSEARMVIEKVITDLSFWEDECEGVANAIKNLRVLVPSDEVKARNDLIIGAWEQKREAINKDIFDAQAVVRKFEGEANKYRAEMAAHKKNEAQMAKLGPGLDTKDEAMIEGLQQQVEGYRAEMAPLIKNQTISDEIRKAMLKAEQAVRDEDAEKEKLQKAVEAMQKVVSDAAHVLAERSKAVLDVGELKLEDDGKNITISWARPIGPDVQRHTLSGGEKVVFDAALGHALHPKAMVCLEAAEVDDERLPKVLEHLNQCPAQVLVMTCHGGENMPDGWTTIRL